VGGSTAATIVANAAVPGLLDRYLGRTGVASQQSDEPDDPRRPFNLWDPVDGLEDHGAHGRFDDRATKRSIQWWLGSRRGPAAAALLSAGAALLLIRTRRDGR
jgi:hypothetical protein